MMTKKNIQAIMYKFSVIAIVSSLAISAITCAPPQVAQPQSHTSAPSATIQQYNPQASAPTQSQHQSHNQRQQQQQAAAVPASSATTTSTTPTLAQSSSIATGQPSNNAPRPVLNNGNNNEHERPSAEQAARDSGDQPSDSNAGPQQPQSNEAAGELDPYLFDGKSPFLDDSLWQIPFQLVGDLADGSDAKQPDDQMTNSASETSSLNDEDDEEQAQSAPVYSPKSAPPAARPSAVDFLSAAQQANPEPSPVAATAAENTDLKTAAGFHYPSHGPHGGHHGDHHHYGGHGYFEYAGVPKPKAWEFGYKRGNSKHTIERYEKGHGPHFSTKVKWSDKKGHGVSTWEYNHGDDYHSDDHYGGHHHNEPHDYHQKKYKHKKHY